jgi:hypothetical protein
MAISLQILDIPNIFNFECNVNPINMHIWVIFGRRVALHITLDCLELNPTHAACKATLHPAAEVFLNNLSILHEFTSFSNIFIQKGEKIY